MTLEALRIHLEARLAALQIDQQQYAAQANAAAGAIEMVREVLAALTAPAAGIGPQPPG